MKHGLGLKLLFVKLEILSVEYGIKILRRDERNEKVLKCLLGDMVEISILPRL